MKGFLVFLLILFTIVPTSAFADSWSMDDARDLVILNSSASGSFGWDVAVCDVNNDGYQDVMAGDAVTSNGTVYIYYAGPGMDNTADVTLTGAASGDRFGRAIGCAGDVNHDGYNDVLIGAQRNDTPGNNAGRAYVYYGGTTMDTTADITFSGETASDEFGGKVAGVGDVNGDGNQDILIASQGYSSSAGRVYLYYGGASTIDTTADLTFTGGASQQWGWDVGGAGDVNGDGFPDVMISSFSAKSAKIYYGGSSMDNTADVTLSGDNNFGGASASAGDVNRDGYGDVIVGDNGTERAYVFYGGVTMDTVADITLDRVTSGDNYGEDVGSVGDVNGDGYEDVMVGAQLADEAGTNSGSAYLYYTGPDMDTTADIVFRGTPGGNLGYRFTHGRLNQDSFPDIVMAVYGDDTNATNAGGVNIYFANANEASVPDSSSSGSDGGGGGGGSDSSSESVATNNPVILQPTQTLAAGTAIRIKAKGGSDTTKMYTVLNKKTYSMYDDGLHGDGKKGDKIYSTNPLTLNTTTSYTVYKEASGTKTSAVGKIVITGVATTSATLIPQINSAFKLVYDRIPTFTEWQYWVERIESGSKTTFDALIGAMQWQKLFGS